MVVKSVAARLIAVLAAAVFSLLGVAAIAAPARAAGGVEVYFAYADTARPDPANFPTPWNGSPGITYEGCTGNCEFDGGAVRIVNNSGSPIRIDSVAVKVSTCTFSMWAPAIIAPGSQLIVAQNASGASNGCPADGTMDTSDVGPGGSQYAGNCNPDGLMPQVDISIDGTVHPFADNSQVLNTGGKDLAACPPNTNESTQWTLIPSSVICAGSTLTLAPASQRQDAGTDATVTATYKNSCGEPLQGAAVDFAVTSGPDAGTTGTGVIDASGHATFTYQGSAAGTDTVDASITNLAGKIQSNDAQVIWDPPITATGGRSFTGTEPAAISSTVASFTDPNPDAQASEYSASVNWGDGTPATAGTISGPAGGPFTVTGNHAYSDEGSYPVTVTITDTDNPVNSATVTDTATISDAALTASGISPLPVSGQSFTGPVADFTDANAATSSPADFTATVNWGDGTPATSGTVTGSGGSYKVSGSHSYAGTGYYTIKVHVADDGGSTADAQTTVLIYGTVKGGSFVIGDGNAATGNQVTFWDAQWQKLNTLADGTAPAAFKGFEDQPAQAACGQAWTTDPGNSTPPPAGSLPAYMAVIVSSSVTQSGSVISGNTPGMVVVKTNGGYSPDPGHPGTGTVTAKIC